MNISDENWENGKIYEGSRSSWLVGGMCEFLQVGILNG